MADYVYSFCPNEDVALGWHMTWAYQADSNHSAFPNYNPNQNLMYKAIVDCVKKKIVPNENFKFVVPAGTAVQNARTSYIGDKLTIDGYHLNALGEYIIGLIWVLKITGWSIDDLDISLVPQKFQMDIEMIKEAALNAVNNPYEITESNCLTKPQLPEIDLTKYTLLDWEPALGFYNSQASTSLITVDPIANQFVSSSKRYSKEDLPNGTIITLEDGYGYRPEGWTSETGLLSGSRPPYVTESRVVIDDEWWGKYVLRAFNVYTTPREDMTKKINDAKNAFKIYVPNNN